MTEEAVFYITFLLSYKTARCHVLYTRYLHFHSLDHLKCLKNRTIKGGFLTENVPELYICSWRRRIRNL